MEQKQLELSLPYAEITAVATRNYLRDNFKRGDRTTYQIPFEDLKEREGFNDRTVFEDIDVLCDSIIAHGLEIPITVDVLADGTIFISEGHRRYRAIKMAREKDNSLFETVECFVNGNKVTELERVIKNYTSNNLSRHLKPLEIASNAYKIKHYFGEEKSNEVVASLMGVSRQTVDNLIMIAEASDDLKNEIKNGDLSFTAAISFLRNQRKIEKLKDSAEENSHKTTDAPTPLPKDELAGEVKELEELYKIETPEEKEEGEFKESVAAEKALEALMQISDEVNTKKLSEHIGRRLSLAAIRTWTEDFVDDESGEVIPFDRSEIIAKEGSLITEEICEAVKDELKTVFLYKIGQEPVAKSVITEPVAGKERDQFDMSREELQWCCNLIKNIDWLSVQSEKLPDQTSKDFVQRCNWLLKDAEMVRDWVSANKKQNKSR